MSPTRSSNQVQVRIDGDISGQVAIGNNILQIGEIHGGTVNIIAPKQKPNFTHRPRPVYIRPRPFPSLLNRTEEIKKAIGALFDSESLSLNGENGIGKTTLLRYLAYNSPGDNFPDGIFYYCTHSLDVNDILEIIFETFYESDCVSKPTDAELHQFLQNIKALILLDDVTLDYSKVTDLTNAAPQCTFVLSSTERCLWGDGCCIKLEGLPPKEALALFERELGRTLQDDEKATAESFCQKAKGHPFNIIQTAALFQRGLTIKEISDRQRETEDAFVKTVLTKLSETEKLILSVLAVTSDAPLPIQRLSELCPIQNVNAALKSLLELKLIQSHSPTYSSAGPLALSLGRMAKPDYLEGSILNYFVRWMKQNPPLPDVMDVLNILPSLIEKVSCAKRWGDVIILGRGIEKALIVSKRWSTWAWILDLILKAAQALDDRTMQAWALHELGTRSLCLADTTMAHQFLTQALAIRDSINDHAGAAVTRHNLGLLPAPPAPPHETPRSRPKPHSGGGVPFVLKIVLVVVAIGLVVFPFILPRIFPPEPPAPQPIPVATTQRYVAPVVPPSKTATPHPTLTPYPTNTFVPTLPPCAPGVLYCENFEDRMAQDWQLDPGWSIQRDGSNQVLGGMGHEFATLAKHQWDDYQLNFRLRLFSGGIHICYRISPGNNGLNRYFIGITDNGMYLSKQLNDQFTDFRRIDWRPSLGDWHDVEISGWGGHLRVYVDGSLKLEIVDQDFIRSGSFAFETLDNSSAQIDDIEVRGPGVEPAVESYAPAPESPSGPSSNTNPTLDTSSGIIIPIASVPARCTNSMTWEQSIDRPGMDYWNGWVGNPDTPPSQKPVICQDMCLNDSNCQAFTYDTYTNVCWLKNGRPDAVYKYENISGIKVCQ